MSKSFKSQGGVTQTTYANGYTVSVATHEYAYSDAGFSTAEVAVIGKDGEFFKMPGCEEVIPFQTPEQVLAIHVAVALM